MSTGAALAAMTADEYLGWERDQPGKHEYHDGVAFAMAGGSPRHNALCAATVGDLRVALRGGRCVVLTSDQRVALRPRRRYVYPDVTVVCGALRLEEGTDDVVTNPAAVVEVLSRRTERYDRGGKWEGYRRIASLDDYLLVSQQAISVEHFQRQPDGSWRYTVAEAGGRITLTCGAALDMDALYEGAFALPGDEASATD